MKPISDQLDFPKLFMGLFFCSLCTSFGIHSNLGVSPWSVFHQGLAKALGITFGQASIAVSLIIILTVSWMGQKVGLGTVLNMIFTGLFVDLFDFLGLIPNAQDLNQGVMMMCLSMMFNAIGSYFYISCAMGCGPRDGLMSVLTQKTRLPVGLVRAGIEFSVLLVGWRLGGQVGLGTLLYVTGIGVFINTVFKIMKFDVAGIRHQTLEDSLQLLRR